MWLLGWLALWFGCTCGPRPERGNTGGSLSVWGLELGKTDVDGLADWLDQQGLHCPAVPSPRRRTVQYRCLNIVGGSWLQRPSSPLRVDLLLARTDDGPLHHVSTVRKTVTPEAAIADYLATVRALTERLGSPALTDNSPPTVAAFAAKLTRFSTMWALPDLTVDVTLSRLSGRAISVRERWDMPGVEAAVGARSKIHSIEE
jgi:hypothetical protein